MSIATIELPSSSHVSNLPSVQDQGELGSAVCHAMRATIATKDASLVFVPFCAHCGTQTCDLGPYYHDLADAMNGRQDYVEIYEYMCSVCTLSTYIDTESISNPYLYKGDKSIE